ncbi:MAG TPA: efflux transporter outer membrane subunit, partial [Rhabdochlamydiaceae bacterium]
MKTRSLIFFTAILSGCMVGPNYQPPETVVSNAWESDSTDIDLAVSEKDVIKEWWKIFNDPLLTEYIEEAAKHNFDVLTAEANILQARALKKVESADLFPHVNADFNATKTYFSKNGPVFAIQAPTPSSPLTTIGTSALPFSIQIPQVQNLYNALLDATWEIDLFGKTQRGVEAAEANIGSATEKRNDTLISVYAEIAMNYMELRSFQQLALLVEQNIQLLEQNQDVVQKRVDTGYSNNLDLLNVQSQLSKAKAEFPPLIARIYHNIYTLSILTGKVPEALVQELMPIQPLPALPQEVAVGLRSDLLRRRPDIRQRERDLAAATATVGVAVASFYPSFSLGGDGGFQSLALSDLFQWSSRTWALGGDFNIPLF